MSIECDRLTVRYGDLTALRALTGRLERGCITAVLGPNAAGKSTLLRCCLGLLRPDEGSVKIADTEVGSIPPRALAKRAAYVAQRPRVSAAFSVREVIELGRYALPRAPQRVEEALRRHDLEHLQQRMFPELSVGQQQRVALARALAQVEPDGCLLLDEPTSAMDFRHEQAAFDELQRAAHGGATVVITLHDINAASSLADALWLLKNGELVMAGPTDRVLSVDLLESVYELPFEQIPRGDGRPFYAPLPRDAM